MRSMFLKLIGLGFFTVIAACTNVPGSSSSSSGGSSSGGASSSGPDTLIPLKSGALMTCQFKNSTGGKFSDSQIYVLFIGLNANNVYCYLDKNGNFTPTTLGDNLSNYAIKLSDFTGYQFPTLATGTRIYISLGSPIQGSINAGNSSGQGTGYAGVNIESATDPNLSTYFEFMELTIDSSGITIDTSQVDQFGFPYTEALYAANGSGYTLVSNVGITNARDSIMSKWTAFTSSGEAANFAFLKQTYRIIAPRHSTLTNSYFDSYINSCWAYYQNNDCVLPMDNGTTYAGRVQSDGVTFKFTNRNSSVDSTVYTFSRKPTTTEVWGGEGMLASGSDNEKNIEKMIVAAFHRHIMDNTSYFSTPGNYYLTGTCDWYSRFFHDINLGNMAYGFCYDDIYKQSTTIFSAKPRGLIINIIW